MAERIPDDGRTWANYYNMTASRPARYFLWNTAQRFAAPGAAVDLGCGSGQETILLLGQGWQVTAIDREATAIGRLQASLAPGLREGLRTEVAAFESVQLEQADLIWAGWSLPFCPPGAFAGLWAKIRAALRPGGRIAGDFFGPRHGWRQADSMTFHSKDEVLALCLGLKLEYLVEEEGLMQTAMDGRQPWHQFTVCARKPAG